MQEVLKNLERLKASGGDHVTPGPTIDFPGVCLNNTPAAAQDLPSQYSEALMKGCTDGLETSSIPCSPKDVANGEKMREVYGRYLFVFSAVNNIENTSMSPSIPVPSHIFAV